jgi:hypothetical protein
MASACTVLLDGILAAGRKLFTRDSFAHRLLSAVAYAYTVAIPNGFAQQFLGVLLGLCPRWRLSPIRCLGVPLRFGCDVIAVCFQWLEVAVGVSRWLRYPCACYLRWLYAYAVATCTGLCPYSCYLHSRLLSTMAFWLMWLLPPLGLLSVWVSAMRPSSFLSLSCDGISLCSYWIGTLSSDSFYSLEVCVGAPFRPLMGLGAPPPFEECMVLDIDRSLGFRRDFSRMALVAVFRYYLSSLLLVSPVLSS